MLNPVVEKISSKDHDRSGPSITFIVVALTSSPCSSLTLTLVVHLSIAITIYSSHISIILSPFSSLLI